RGTARLIVDHANLALLLRQLEHGGDEVSAERAIYPRHPQDCVLRLGGCHRALAREFGAAIAAERRREVRLAIRRGLLSVEDIVGRQVDDRDAELARAN